MTLRDTSSNTEPNGYISPIDGSFVPLPAPTAPQDSGEPKHYKHAKCDRAIIEERLDDACEGCKMHPQANTTITMPVGELPNLQAQESGDGVEAIEEILDGYVAIMYRPQLTAAIELLLQKSWKDGYKEGQRNGI